MHTDTNTQLTEYFTKVEQLPFKCLSGMFFLLRLIVIQSGLPLGVLIALNAVYIQYFYINNIL